jgi:hypothetical protein
MSSVSPTSRYPKRKRQEISYIEPADDEGLDLDLEPQLESKLKPENDKKIDDDQESDEDLEYGSRKKKKTKVQYRLGSASFDRVLQPRHSSH